MQEVVELIRHVQATLMVYGKYQVLFYLALFYLLFKQNKKSDNQKEQIGVLIYMLVGLILLWNPLFVAAIIHVFPQFASYWQLLWVLPMIGVIAYAGTLVLAETKEYTKKKSWWIYLSIICVIFSLAGTIMPYESETVKAADNAYGIPTRQMEVLERLDEEKGTITLLAPDAVMGVARRYNGATKTLYGRTLWSTSVPKDTADAYEEADYKLYALMQEPTGHEEEITKMAAERGCNYLVVSNVTIEQEEAEVPRDPNAIVDLSVDGNLWCLHGFQLLDETECYYILRR